MQLGCYVLMKFEAVERYLDLIMMGFLLLERQRLSDLECDNTVTSPKIATALGLTRMIRTNDPNAWLFSLV